VSASGDLSGMRLARSFRRDPGVTDHRLAPGTVRRVLSFARPYRRLLLGFLGLVVVDAAIGAVNPLIFRAIIDDGVRPGAPHGDVGVVMALAGVVALLAVVAALVSLVTRWLSARVGEGLIYDMRAAVFGHIQRQPLAFFTRTQTGALVSRLNNDVLGAQQAFTGTLSSVVSNVLSVAFVLVAMAALSWQVTVVALLLVPVFVIPARLMGRRLVDITRESFGLNAEMNTIMNERFNVAGALLVKLFGDHATEDAEFRSRASRVRDIGITSALYGRIFFVSLTLVSSLGVAVTYGVGGRLAADRALAVGTLVALTAYLSRLYGPLTALSNVRVDVLTALVSFERVFEVLDLKPAIADAPDAVPLPPVGPGGARVRFLDVQFRYPAATEVSLASLENTDRLSDVVPPDVLHGVSFTAEPGRTIALVGPSGAGKTTISQLVTRMYDVSAGRVEVADRDVRSVTLGSLRDAVGVVTQDAHLFHDTLGTNLRYARPGATDDELWAALEGAHIADLVRSLPEGLDTLVGDRGYRLSGGEKQRVAIARLLLKNPPVVVLDEATAHLDNESERAVQRALATALTGRTALVIAHRLSTVRHADEILVVVDGRIAERGTHDELLALGGVYAELSATQLRQDDPEEGMVPGR
jgi:ATP-binding cassette subfamily B protein